MDLPGEGGRGGAGKRGERGNYSQDVIYERRIGKTTPPDQLVSKSVSVLQGGGVLRGEGTAAR